MKKIPLLVYLLTILFASSCQKSVGLSPKDVLSRAVSEEVRKPIPANVLNNEYLDVDLTKVYKGEQLSGQESIYARAAVYRFYKHVRLQDSAYVTDLKEGREINISEPLFAALTKNIDDMNSVVRKQNAEGKTTDLYQIDEKYLNALTK